MEESPPFSWKTTTGSKTVRPAPFTTRFKEMPSTRKMVMHGFTTCKERASATLYWLTDGRFGNELSSEYQAQLTTRLVLWWVCKVLVTLDLLTGASNYFRVFTRRR